MTTASIEVLGSGAPDGTLVVGTGEKVAFYGRTPVVIRPYSSAVHATAGVATSASFGATQLAALQEVQLTLIGLGLYATV